MKMNIKKFETFDELKSYQEDKNTDYKSSLKKHNNFKKFIKLLKKEK